MAYRDWKFMRRLPDRNVHATYFPAKTDLLVVNVKVKISKYGYELYQSQFS